MSNLALRVENLSIAIQGRKLISKANFTFFGGKIYRITGDNGSGKSTLIAALAGLLGDSKFKIKGNIFLGEENINEISALDRAKNIGVVLSPLTNALIGQKVEDELAFALFNMKKSYDYVEKKVEEVTDSLGISHLLCAQTNKISTGQNALVALAAVLCMDSEIYLFDEIFGALDEVSASRAVAAVNAEKEKGKCIIFVNHALPRGLIPDVNLTIAEEMLV